MRLWSVHPEQLDRAALVACWREALLAQKVLAGLTKGYTRHPQLERFRSQPDPLATIARYLEDLADEADARGYRFDRTRITHPGRPVEPVAVTDGQLALEFGHLLAKLEVRSPTDAVRLRGEQARPHPLFHLVPGPVESWERAEPA